MGKPVNDDLLELDHLHRHLRELTSNIEELVVCNDVFNGELGFPDDKWRPAFRGAMRHALEQFREDVKSIEPAFEIALIQLEDKPVGGTAAPSDKAKAAAAAALTDAKEVEETFPMCAHCRLGRHDLCPKARCGCRCAGGEL